MVETNRAWALDYKKAKGTEYLASGQGGKHR
jgi:hypothetical protein